MEEEVLVRAERLSKKFQGKSGLLSRRVHFVRAVEDVDLSVWTGEALGLVGESGSGKTTLGKLLIRLIEPTAGELWFGGNKITGLSGNELRAFRAEAQMVFQDPYSSLNPRMKVRDIVGEPLLVHRGSRGKVLDQEVAQLLELVGLSSAFLDRRPHEFSGGQRQRIGIARALALRPRLLILDEPTSALDVSVQAQIVQLIDTLRRELGLTYVFISHDLALVSLLCDRIGVMYLGRLMEVAPAEELFRHPLHPYSQALLDSVPRLEPGTLKASPLSEVGVSQQLSEGCKFQPRCPRRLGGICETAVPDLVSVNRKHTVACHLFVPAAVG